MILLVPHNDIDLRVNDIIHYVHNDMIFPTFTRQCEYHCFSNIIHYSEYRFRLRKYHCAMFTLHLVVPRGAMKKAPAIVISTERSVSDRSGEISYDYPYG